MLKTKNNEQEWPYATFGENLTQHVSKNISYQLSSTVQRGERAEVLIWDYFAAPAPVNESTTYSFVYLSILETNVSCP